VKQVKAFQKRKKLSSPPGVVDAETWRALLGLPKKA
jgi:peptidoglycan hydrolase-like protein with peptidoglycan-binding domain